MNKTFLQVIKYGTMFAIGLLLLWLTFKDVDIEQTWQKIKNANWFWVWLSVICSVAAYFSRAYRWNMLIETAGYKPRFMASVYAVCIAYFANLALPRMGEVTRCGTLGKKENIPFDVLLGTVIVERVIDVLTLLVAMLFLLLWQYDLMYAFLTQHVLKNKPLELDTIQWVLIFTATTVVVFCVFKWIMLPNNAMAKKVRGFIAGVFTGLKSVQKLKNLPLFIFHSTFIWVLYLMMVFVGFKALQSTSMLTFNASLFILVAGGLGMTAPVQGGIGAYHLLVSAALVLFGVAYEDGLAFATLLHTAQMLQIVVLGLLALLALTLMPQATGKKTVV
ncbi:MAG: flippase-like domain-containing protein [Bacteroidia bacterium]|nr:flippase-like domain-containing protein [Bacteroidia bacterium]